MEERVKEVKLGDGLLHFPLGTLDANRGWQTAAVIAHNLIALLSAVVADVTIIVVLLLGNPSSGGANGVAYLPSFWQDLGPFLPPRNGYLLLRNSVYFSGNSITQPLVVLLLYFVVFGVISSLLGNFRTPKTPVTPETEVEATAMTGAAAGSP